VDHSSAEDGTSATSQLESEADEDGGDGAGGGKGKRRASSSSRKKVRSALRKTLQDPALRPAFEDWLEAEYASENLQFWDQVAAFEKRYPDATESTRRAHARKMVNAFVHYSGLFSVNLPSDMR